MRHEDATDLFLEPFGGLAGDMFLAALLDLGDERFTLADLRALAGALVPGECTIELEPTKRRGIAGRLLTVRTPESARPPHRHLSDCVAMLEASPLPAAATARAVAVFERLARAEANVHATTPERIHFHEVGAVDALVDVAGVCLALERLGVRRVFATAPLAGEGTVDCAHGTMPVPPPATVELLRGRPLVLGGGPGERLTPTGAALLAEWTERFGPPGEFSARAVGYGAGHRDPEGGPPNLCRAQLGAAVRGPVAPRRTAWLLEFNLDDATGEEVGFLLERLREAGALEAWTAPVHMKKDRPGVVVTALCREARRGALEAAAFGHSGTLGVRWSRTERTECPRETIEVAVRGRTIRVGRRVRPGTEPGEPPRPDDLGPEYDDLARAAAELGLPLRTLEREAVDAALERLRANRTDAPAG